VHPQETERAPIGGKEAYAVPPQRDHDVVIEAAPRHTGDEEPNDQSYNIISQYEYEDVDLPQHGTTYNRRSSPSTS